MVGIFYRNVRLLVLTITLIIVWGITSYQVLPRLEDPTIVSRIAIVTTFLPGASAERVEALVTERIEDEISEIEEIKNYQSISRTGSSVITIELLDRVKQNEADVIWSRVRSRLQNVQAEIPQDATEPELEETEVRSYAYLVALTWNQSDSPNYAILSRKAKTLQDRLRSIDGTEKVDIFGAPEEEITIEVNSSKLGALGLTAQDLSRQIEQSDSKVAAGQIYSSSNDLPIEVEGELDSLERVRKIPIRCVSCSLTNNNESHFTYLGNIAQIQKGIANPPRELNLVGGKTAISVAVFVDPEKRLDQWRGEANKIIEEFQGQLSSSINLQVIFDQYKYTKIQLDRFIFGLLWGALFLCGVTFIMMGWRSGLVVQATLTLSILIVFGGMNFIGIPLHQTSLTGLIISSGILIDSAVIIVDETNDRLKKGIKPKAAAIISSRHLTIPLSAATLTTVISFLPIVLTPGDTGEFINSIGMVVILAICASLFVSLTITPVLASQLYNYKKHQGLIAERSISPLFGWWQTGFASSTLANIYRRTLNWSYARPILAIILSLTLPVAGFFLASTLDIRFLPTADRDQFEIQLELSPSSSIEQTKATAHKIRERLIDHPEIIDVHWFIGRSAPRFYYNLITDRENESNFAHALVQMNVVRPRASVLEKLQAQLDSEFPEARVILRRLEQSPPTAAPIEMRLYGSNIEVLQSLGEEARAILAQVDGVIHTRANLNEFLPELQINVDEEAARQTGLDKRTIAQELDETFEGTIGGSILESEEEIPVRVRLPDADRGNINQISSLNLLSSSTASNNDGNTTRNLIPLSALSEVRLKPELSTITRRNGERVNIIQGFVEAGDLPVNTLAEFKKQLADNFNPLPNYSFDFGGEEEVRSDAVTNLLATVGVLMILMVATLVLSLNSFRLASLIGVIAFSSAGMAFLSVWLFGYPAGFNTIIGTMGMVGVAVNDSITLLSALEADPDANIGDPKAVREIVVGNTRHVLTTSATTVVSCLPLIIGEGGFWPPLAVSLAGGVAGATLLSLYLIPPAYLLLRRKKTRFARLKF